MAPSLPHGASPVVTTKGGNMMSVEVLLDHGRQERCPVKHIIAKEQVGARIVKYERIMSHMFRMLSIRRR